MPQPPSKPIPAWRSLPRLAGLLALLLAGTLTVDFHLLPDIAESVAIAPDGMTVLGGFVQQNVDGYGLARVLQ